MSQTSVDSKNLVEICFSELQNNPEKKNSKYKIFNGKDQSARIEISVGPGMILEVKDGIETTPENIKKILENQKNRLTEKQVSKGKNTEKQRD